MIYECTHVHILYLYLHTICIGDLHVTVLIYAVHLSNWIILQITIIIVISDPVVIISSLWRCCSPDGAAVQLADITQEETVRCSPALTK